MFHGHRDLKVYQLAYKLAMDIFNESKTFPKDERYSLTDQICGWHRHRVNGDVCDHGGKCWQ